LLRGEGHEVTWTRSVADWPSAEGEIRPEIVIAAVESPDEMLASRRPVLRGFPPAILFVQNDSDLSTDPKIEDRLVDGVRCPFMPEELLARVDALVKVRRVVLRAPVEGASAHGSFGRGLRALFSPGRRREPLPSVPYLEVAMQLADWADRRDMFEPGHAGRVASFCAMMADGMDLPDHEVGVLLRAAMLHDVGKVTVPADILRQNGPLDEAKMRLVRTHPERGAALLRALDSSDEVARAVLYHHERPDGTGYYGKAKDAVPRAAKMLAVAEAFDAMTAARWCEPVSRDQALGRLRERRGGSYDEESVEALVLALEPKSTRVPVSV